MSAHYSLVITQPPLCYTTHSSAFDIPRIMQAAEPKIKDTARRCNIEK